MWFFELIGIFVTIGFLTVLFMLFGVLQVLQGILAVCFFLFVLPFVALGAFLGNVLRQTNK